MKINKKTLSRIAAIQAVFNITSLEDSKQEDTIEWYKKYYNEDKYMAEDLDLKGKFQLKISNNFFELLSKNALDNLDILDVLIGKFLKISEVSEVDSLAKAILRVGAGELKYCPDTPYKVVINEYTNIANEMLKQADIGFVNSVLDNLSEELGRKKEDIKKESDEKEAE